MPSDKVKELVKLRSTYYRGLGEIFHHKSASDLARLSLEQQLNGLVTDYIQICLPQFREAYEIERSQLEEDSSQSEPLLKGSWRDPAADKYSSADEAVDELQTVEGLRDGVTLDKDKRRYGSSQSQPK